MASILQGTWASGTPEARTREKVLERVRLTQERYAGQNQQFRTLSRYYLSLSPHIRAKDNDRPTAGNRDDYPDLFVPRSFTAVEAAVPPWVFSVVGGHPPVKVYARKQDHGRGAESVEEMIAYDWDRSEVLHRSIGVAKQIFKYGTGIAKIGYKYDAYTIERKYDITEPVEVDPETGRATKTRTRQITDREEVRRFDGPWLDQVSVFNAGPDPYYSRIRDMRYFWNRRWTDRKTLELENENHQKLHGKPKYKNLDKIPAVRTGYVESVYQMDYGDDMAEAMGWSGSHAFSVNKYVHSPHSARQKMEDDLVEIVEYWDRDDRLVVLANEETPILDGPNPFDDKELPFVAARCYEVDGQFWGLGYLYTMRRPQEELNANRNLFYRQGQLNILNVWGYNEATGVDPDLDLEPGTLNAIPMDADGNPGIVPLYKGQPLPPEAYQIEDRIDNDMQLANGQPFYNTGAVGADSATEANIAQQNVQQRSRLQALQGELTYATEIARFFHSRRQQFLRDDGEEFRILGDKGPDYKILKREDIAGEYDFMTAGQYLHASQDVVRQQLEQVLTIVGGNPVFMQMTDLYEVWREMWRMFGFDRVDRFLNPPPGETVPAEIENKVLSHGEWTQTNMMDDHEEHIQSHMRAMPTARNMEAMEMFNRHIAEHQKQVRTRQQAAPPQEQPGLRGYQGNVPNLDNAVETAGGLAARVGGAGQGT